MKLFDDFLAQSSDVLKLDHNRSPSRLYYAAKILSLVSRRTSPGLPMTFNAATPPLRSHAGHLEDVWTLQRVSTTLREVACQLSEGLGRCWGQGLEPIRVLVTKSLSPLGAGTQVQAIAQLAQHVIEVVPAISSSA